MLQYSIQIFKFKHFELWILTLMFEHKAWNTIEIIIGVANKTCKYFWNEGGALS